MFSNIWPTPGPDKLKNFPLGDYFFFSLSQLKIICPEFSERKHVFHVKRDAEATYFKQNVIFIFFIQHCIEIAAS